MGAVLPLLPAFPFLLLGAEQYSVCDPSGREL